MPCEYCDEDLRIYRRKTGETVCANCYAPAPRFMPIEGTTVYR